MSMSQCVCLKVTIEHLSHDLVHPRWWEHSAFDLCALEINVGQTDIWNTHMT